LIPYGGKHWFSAVSFFAEFTKIKFADLKFKNILTKCDFTGKMLLCEFYAQIGDYL